MGGLTRAIGAGLLAVGIATAPAARAVVIDPSDDAALYVCQGCNVVSNGQYLLVSGYIQGAVKFPTAPIAGPIEQALLAVNPYGLPLFDLVLQVYGYTANNGSIGVSDANAGTFLGTWTLPPDLGYGEDAFFDVTDFLASVTAPFVAFNLRNATGTDVFSSLEYNYGHPAQLHVTLVPEPTTLLLVTAGLGGIGTRRRRTGVR